MNCRIPRQLGGVFDYTVTAELTGGISPVSSKVQNISVKTLNGRTIKAEKSVYNLENNTVTLYLAPQTSYDSSYKVTVANVEYLCNTESSAAPKKDEVSIKNVKISDGEATVSVYNPTFSAVDVKVTAKTSDGEFSTELTIPEETVGTCIVLGNDLENAEWTVETM